MGKLEKDIEQKLVNIIESYGGRCLKWVCPGWTGVPDRIVLMPGGRIAFIELKRPGGGRISAMQDWWRRELHRLEFLHFYVFDDNSLESLEMFLQVWQAGGPRG